MKNLRVFILSLLATLGCMTISAQELPTGLYGVGDEVSALETGKWYFLMNHGTSKYIKEDASKALKQVSTPNGVSVSGNEGYLVCLEDAGDGKFYIKTGLGNYYKAPSSSARGTGTPVASTWALTISTIDDNAGHFIIQGTTFTMIAPNNGSDVKGGTNKTLNSIGDWGFVEVKTTSVEELTGRDLYNYQMSQLGLVRLHNKRVSTSYLTTNDADLAKGAAKATSGLGQVWILEESSEGYTLRSANTGQYLQSDFATPAAGAAVLYIQFSPNNTGTEAYCNISSKDDFSGSSCLNLGNDGTTLHKWSYSGDAGSDWAIELVEDVSEEDVRMNLNDAKGYVSALEDGAYYHIVSFSYGRYMTEADNVLKGLEADATNYSQCWKVTKSSTGYNFQNVVSQKYVQPQYNTSEAYVTGDNVATLFATRVSDKWEYKWVITDYSGGSQGLHTSSSQGYSVVHWSTSAAASEWAFVKVELTDEEIEAARSTYQEFQVLQANVSTYQTYLDNLFADKACTTLKSEIQALSDDALAENADYAALNADMKAMVLKVKNDTWQQYTNTATGYSAGYEKFFRIADYKVYSNYQDMANGENFTMSNAFGKLSGPTGIVANSGNIIYIYVDEAPSSDCTLQLEAVSTNGVPGGNQTGVVTDLHQGLNVYMSNQQVMLYIFYQLNDTKKYLADYDDMKIHIEGGQLNGYWDATRGMTNADWVLLQRLLLKSSPVLNLKTEHLVFCMDASLVKQSEPSEMEGLMRIWDRIPVNEERYMGVEDFEGRFNNIWNVFSVNYNYMYASTYGTYYNNSTLGTVMNCAKMRSAGNIWGPSHEIGHNHQATINVVGTTESSNNMFSNINRFEQGIQTTRRQLPPDVFNDLANGTTWVQRNIWNTTSMFFQLYLYFHGQHHDDQFLPNLFRAMRANPLVKRSGWDSTTEFVDGGETKTGANITYGKLDYLHLAKTICDVAQADLSEFFEAYGMFVPADKVFVGDYANYLVTTTQDDIDAAKKYMQRYPKKLGNIMFIDDHVVVHEADPDNIFEGDVPANGLRINDTGQHDELSNGYPVGDVGDYTSYDGHEEYDVDKDYFTISSGKVIFKGSGYIGHKFYDLDGNLLWATNAKTSPMPTILKNMDPTEYVVVAAQQNMTDVPCPYFKRGDYPVYSVDVNFGSEDNQKIWYVNAQTKLGDYMPENAVGVLASASAPEDIINTANVISSDNTAQSIVINGEEPWYLPTDVTAASVAFTKSATGYAAFNLPFSVTSTNIEGLKTATYDGETLSISDATTVEAGQPVIVNGDLNLALENTTVKAGSFQPLSAVFVLAADGASLEAVGSATAFTYPFSEATAIHQVVREGDASTSASEVYDLMGRRVNHMNRGIYIINGKNVIVK